MVTTHPLVINKRVVRMVNACNAVKMLKMYLHVYIPFTVFSAVDIIQTTDREGNIN